MMQCLWLVADLYFDGFMANAKSLHDEVYYNVEGSLGDKERRGRVVESGELRTSVITTLVKSFCQVGL